MQRFVWVVLALILSTLVQARDACAEQRVALVIGNGAYGKVPRLPKQDPYATALPAELVKPGRNDLLMFHNVGAWDTETLTSHSKNGRRTCACGNSPGGKEAAEGRHDIIPEHA